MQDKIYDVIVIGGGMAGAHAAKPLVEAGKEVLMLDGGVTPVAPAYDAQGRDFERMRREDDAQHRLFIGEDADTALAASSKSHAASMTSANRAHVSERTDTELPLALRDVEIIQSLAKGGLSEAWGGVCAVFTERDLQEAGMPTDMHKYYQAAMDEAGISGEESGYRTQPPARVTSSMQALLERYRMLSSARRKNFMLRRPLVALLTQPLNGRQATRYDDLDYYRTDTSSIYRARYTLEALEKRRNFTYAPGHVVQRFESEGGSFRVHSRTFSGETKTSFARRVILAAGAINSTRIMLQSDSSLRSAELMFKPNYIIACADPRMLGSIGETKRYSFAQLTIDRERAGGESAFFAHLYNYRPLLLWKLLRFVPLPVPETLSLLSMLAPAVVLVDVRFPGYEGRCEASLVDGKLSITPKGGSDRGMLLSELKKFVRSLGLIPVRMSQTPLGASVHCGGGIKVSPNAEAEGHPGVFVADSAGWRALPAKPPALTIMANAQRIGEEVLKGL